MKLKPLSKACQRRWVLPCGNQSFNGSVGSEHFFFIKLSKVISSLQNVFPFSPPLSACSMPSCFNVWNQNPTEQQPLQPSQRALGISMHTPHWMLPDIHDQKASILQTLNCIQNLRAKVLLVDNPATYTHQYKNKLWDKNKIYRYIWTI